MNLLTAASTASILRGYDYAREPQVQNIRQTGPSEYEAQVQGTQCYQVKLNTDQVYESRCTCPRAAGGQTICKHITALYFAAFPQEARRLEQQLERGEQELLRREDSAAANTRRYILRLSKKELQDQLFEALMTLKDYDQKVEEYERRCRL